MPGDPLKLSIALGKCTAKLEAAFVKVATQYPGAGPTTEPVGTFETYPTQCSDDTAAAAGGAALPDYVGELASCNADLATAQSDLTMPGRPRTCEAAPPVQLLKTSQTTSVLNRWVPHR